MEFGLLPLAIIEKHKQKNSVRELCPSLRSNLLDDVSHLCASVWVCVCVCAFQGWHVPWQQAWLHPQWCSARSVKRADMRNSQCVCVCLTVHILYMCVPVQRRETQKERERVNICKTAWAAAVHCIHQHFTARLANLIILGWHTNTHPSSVPQ